MAEGRHKGGANPFEPRRRARRRALQALYQWQLNDDSAAAIIGQFLEEQNFEGVDQGYFETLVSEVVQRREELDAAVAPYLKRVQANMDQMERVILRLGANELLHHPETPYRVVIDEALELSHRFGAEQAHTFVNGVLDRLAGQCRNVERDAERGEQ
ncbi:transcription antitermination factor NusB [Wenzhouxiangella limi]|uniref:Transcription antitermination protein NusB n=1 Tax=Wenzhouxiangella limi TaxID=2707351 RepID=A0A845V5C9_9GAMM|nr:transcription antitermination factor NusB [Wenzhouxiangella limi]